MWSLDGEKSSALAAGKPGLGEVSIEICGGGEFPDDVISGIGRAIWFGYN